MEPAPAAGGAPLLPSELSDILVLNATPDRYVAWADTAHGSLFTRAVCTVLADPEAKAGERKVTNPHGGFTDVGRHTGGEPRNTAWPLVR